MFLLCLISKSFRANLFLGSISFLNNILNYWNLIIYLLLELLLILELFYLLEREAFTLCLGVCEFAGKFSE